MIPSCEPADSSRPSRGISPAGLSANILQRGKLGRRPRRPRLDNPGVADPGVRGLALWRRAVAARWTILAIALVAPLPALDPAAASVPAPAQGGPPTEPTGLLFHTADGELLPAPILDTDVRLRVTGMIVRARVIQRFVNPHEEWMEGIYTFPLPETAAVDGLDMILGGRVVQGQIHEKEEARQVYETAKREGVKTSLVEQQRPNLFTTRVANIGPGEEVEVELRYQQTLDWEAGSFRLRFPMTITPRYHPSPDVPRLPPTVVTTSLSAVGGGTSSSGAPEVAWEGYPGAPGPGGSQASCGNQQSLAPGVQRAVRWTGPVVGAVDTAMRQIYDPSPPVNPLRLTVELDAGVPLASLDSPHHAVDLTEIDGNRGRYEITLARGAVSADRDFELVWRPELGSEPRAALFTEELGLDTYALLMVLPPDSDSVGFQRLPRETIFVIDISVSMAGASLREAKASLLFALDRLAPEDSFNVLSFSARTRALFPGSWPADPEVIDRARNWVRGLTVEGGTEMLPALLAALDGRPEGYGDAGARAVKQVIFITDGGVDNEDELFTAIETHLGEAHLFTVGIGSAPNSHFMRRAAEMGRGTFTQIGDGGQVRERMQELFTKLESPALTGVEVQWDDPGAEMYPQWVPDLYAGEPVVVAARLIHLGDQVRLVGQRDGSWWDEELPLAALTSRSAVGGSANGESVIERSTDRGGGTVETGIGKLWARRKITALLDEWRRTPTHGPDGSPSPKREELRRQVVELAVAHHLVSRFTSLVAVDVTPERPDGSPLASRRVPNVRPAGATWQIPGYLPSGGTSARRSLWLGLALLSLVLVLRRLLGPLGASVPRFPLEPPERRRSR
jgi:Ca-activated chloride channel family protein